ncbi:uncharacterized protein TNCV_1361731 [Trichonephila clavipes]|nr:uncharacterized protein TNCV_1361731 [Trichonephila clavipes]
MLLKIKVVAKALRLVSATCKYCGSRHTSMTSNTVSDGYEVNLRFVYGMRCIGIGKSAAQIFCALMNLPPPPAKFERLYTPIFKALETVSSRSMASTLVKAFVKLTTSEFVKLRWLFKKASKEARTTKRQIKRKQDALEQSMQDEYSAGNC